MNSKRRAELQRKLTLNSVPRPPAGLKDRIVADIPKYLEPERSRFSSAVAFNMRVAASILLLVTGTLTALYLLTPQAEQPMAVSAVAQKNVARDLGISSTSTTASAAPAEEVNLEIEETDVARIAAAARPIVQAPASNEQQRLRADAPAPERQLAEAFAAPPPQAGAETADAEVGTRGRFAPEQDDARREQTIVVSAEAPASAPAPAPVPVPAAPEPAPAPRFADELRRSTAAPAPVASGSLVTQAHAAKISLERKSSVFGISIDPSVFQRIKTTLESGQRPPASAVNVDALVNYFAGQPASRPRRGVRLEVEASPAAIEADGDHAILRFTIDTPNAKGPAGGSIPPVAADARVEVEFNDRVVASAHPVGDANPGAQESALLAGTSVTGLYALELKPNLSAKQLVATVRLHYKSIETGRTHTITREIHGRDLAKSWARSTPRHRRASLGALWGETLKGTVGGSAVARRAEELATQNPTDARARELAEAASASAGGR